MELIGKVSIYSGAIIIYSFLHALLTVLRIICRGLRSPTGETQTPSDRGLGGWRAGKYGVHLLYHYSWFRMVELIRVQSKSQTDLFKNYSYSIGLCATKKKQLRNNYTTVIMNVQ